MAENLALLNVVIAAIGVAFVILALTEYRRLSKIRSDFARFQAEMRAEAFAGQKAMHRIMASYGLKDIEARIQILEEAAKISPSAFNVHNALGWAYIEAGQRPRAIDAFKDAIHHHPTEKAGYFDLAYAHKTMGEEDLCIKYLRKAIEVDPSSRKDLDGNVLFKDIAAKV